MSFEFKAALLEQVQYTGINDKILSISFAIS